MRVKLLLPYYPDGAVANDENDMSDEEYANALLNSFGDSYMKYMNSVVDGISDSRYGMVDVMPEQYRIKSVKDTTRTEYYEFGALLYNEDYKDMSYSELEYYRNTGDMFAVYIRIGSFPAQYTNNPDAVGELCFWLKDSYNVMNNPHIEEDYKVGMLPHKDLIIQETDQSGTPIGRRYCLSGSRVIDQDDSNNFALIVNKIKNI